jgi:hypothetical protein
MGIKTLEARRSIIPGDLGRPKVNNGLAFTGAEINP